MKNTMLRLAIKDSDLAGMTDALTGSTALAISKEMCIRDSGLILFF